MACVYDFASLSKQLLDKAQQLSRIAEALAAQKQLSRLKRVERFAKLQQQATALALTLALALALALTLALLLPP